MVVNRLIAVAALAIALLGNATIFVVNQRAQNSTTGLTKRVQSLALENCSTINENTTALYQVASAFKVLAEILNGVPGALPPGGKLHATVDEPEYIPCKAKLKKEAK